MLSSEQESLTSVRQLEILAKREGPLPPYLFVSADSKGVSAYCKCFGINSCKESQQC